MTALRVSMPQSVPRPSTMGTKFWSSVAATTSPPSASMGRAGQKSRRDKALDAVALLGLEVGGAGGQDVAEKVALGDAAYVLLVFVEHGNGRVAVVGEALEPLADGVVLVQEGGVELGYHQFCNVHYRPPEDALPPARRLYYNYIRPEAHVQVPRC